MEGKTLSHPEDRKMHRVYPGGHGVMGQWRNQIIQESLDWFDKYLGPIHEARAPASGRLLRNGF